MNNQGRKNITISAYPRDREAYDGLMKKLKDKYPFTSKIDIINFALAELLIRENNIEELRKALNLLSLFTIGGQNGKFRN